jgi:diguanylate cyclase (GGDEF)-like protein
MNNAKLLIVEDDLDISNMLKIFFGSQNYLVETALRGSDALEMTRHNLPHLIILDIMLPDVDGFEVCRTLRTHTRTSHVPIIFLTQKDERSDKLQGLELGADDYITKPFDIEELKLRVQRAITRSEQQSLTDPRSGLPSGRLIEEQLRRIIRLDSWTYMDIRINHFEAFKDVYGFVASDDVLRFTAMLLSEILDELGATQDFIGHVGGDNFVVITSEEAAPAIFKRLLERFSAEILSHYSFIDREQGFITVIGANGKEEQAPMMNLAIGSVSPSQFDFVDIREITELAAEVRRQKNYEY